MPTIQINALDTLFFRDGKPFSMGDETFAEGVFPPAPSVIYGALRSAFLSEHPQYIASINTDEDPTKLLKITQITFFQQQKKVEVSTKQELKSEKEQFLLFPVPLDIVIKKTEKAGFVEYNLGENDFTAKMTFPKINIYGKEVETGKGFINRENINRYLQGKHKSSFYQLHEKISLDDPKIGNGRDNITHSVEESLLYRVNMNRLNFYKNEFKDAKTKDVVLTKDDVLTIIVQYELPNFEDWQPKIIKLGGEGKVAGVKTYEYPQSEKVKCDTNISRPRIRLNFNEEDQYFKLYLSTPTIFEQGFLPKGINPTTFKGIWKGIEIEIITAFSNKPSFIGGFDIQKKRPKPMYKALSAGTVFYCKVLSKNVTEDLIFEAFNGKALSEYYATEGFGIAYVGNLEF
jgi:CRISPR-associated protein Cmr3